MIGLIIDGVLLLMAVIYAIRHARLGFIKSVLSSVKAFAALGIAYILRAPVARLVDSMFMRNVAYNWVYNSLMASKAGTDPTFNLVTLYEDFPVAFNLLSKFGLDLTDIEGNLGAIETLPDEAIAGLADSIGGALSSLISTVIAFVVVFIIAMIILSVIIALLNVITRLPVIKFLNRVLGAVIGVFWALLSAWSVGMVITIISGFVPSVVSPELINESIILNFLSSLSLFDKIPGISA